MVVRLLISSFNYLNSTFYISSTEGNDPDWAADTVKPHKAAGIIFPQHLPTTVLLSGKQPRIVNIVVKDDLWWFPVEKKVHSALLSPGKRLPQGSLGRHHIHLAN